MAVKPFDVTKLGKAALFDPKEMSYRDSLDVIKDESLKLQKSFVKIGWYLKHIQDNELYLEDGYANINECAADQFGYSQSTVSRFIGICEKFSKDHNSPELDEKYEGFDRSQMMEMLPMSPEQLETVTPDMTVKQIRDLKGSKKEKTADSRKADKAEESAVPGQTSIEEDFPEYMPEPNEMEFSDTQDNYATSHREQSHEPIISISHEPIISRDLWNQTQAELQRRSSSADAAKEDDEATMGEDNVVDGTYKELAVSPQEPIQPKLPLLKNNEERKAWLRKYHDWGLWYRDKNIDVNYYKFDFDDGSCLIVAEYPQRHCYWSKDLDDECFYHLLEKNKEGYEDIYDESFRHEPNNQTYLIDFLKRIQKKQ